MGLRSLGQSKRSFRTGHGFSFNSAGGTIKIVHEPNPGEYTVTFQQLGGPGPRGTVQVSEYLNDNTECKTRGWTSSGNDLVVSVLCFDAVGGKADSRFNVLVVRDNISAAK